MHARGNGTNADDFGHWEKRWVMVPINRGVIMLRPDGSLLKILEDEIGTADAAVLLGCNLRTIQRACDQGNVVEGKDWRKVYGQGGRGQYLIRRDAVLRMRGAI